MRTSEKCSGILTIIAEIQHAIDPVVKNKTVTVEGERARWSSNYATLGVLAKAVEPHLKAHKIAKIQDVGLVPTLGPVLITRLQFGDEWIEADYPIKQTRDGSQGFGGGISFAKRWAICGIFDIIPDDVEEGQGYRDVKAQNKAPRKAGAPSGIAGLLQSIREAESCDLLIVSAATARSLHPTGEASGAVERAIETWFVDACENARDVDTLTSIRDTANKVKPRGTDVRAAISKAGARLEPR